MFSVDGRNKILKVVETRRKRCEWRAEWSELSKAITAVFIEIHECGHAAQNMG